ncbi:hypothetical protein FOL47_009606 [Perkinsus chesapeaki]|uniref:t-SNARE coiled-coil homology domain-containing protein n=1 Tax=Perkinsus chesapeaki TaxID=330153 RepID=A0A7J6MSN0_PERCH|nr:hypothetical protein FOL47_009606 [Perkinsus chesapeaki]
MASAASDPFYVARDEVQSSVDEMTRCFQKWQAKQSNGGNLARSSSFAELQDKLKDDTHSLTADLRDVDASIRAVEKHPERFPHCSSSELTSRREWAARMRQQVRTVKNAISSEAARSRLSKDREMLQMEEGEARRAVSEENSKLIGTNRQVQQQLVQEQDEQLDDLARVTHRLGEAAQAINVELYDQQRMLSELDENIDRQQEQMNFVMGGLSRLLKTSDHKQLCTVIALMSSAPRLPPVVAARGMADPSGASAASTNLARLLDLRDLGRRYDSRVLRQWLMDQEIEQELAGLEGIPSRDDASQALVRNYEHFDLQLTAYKVIGVAMLAGGLTTAASLMVAAVVFNSSDAWEGLGDPRKLADICATTPSIASVAPWLSAMVISSAFEIAAVMWLVRQSHLETWDYIGLVCGVSSRMVILMDVLSLVLFYRCTGSLFLTYIIVWALSVGVGQLLPMLRSLCALVRRRDLYSLTGTSAFGPVSLLWPGSWCKSYSGPPGHIQLRGDGGGGAGGGPNRDGANGPPARLAFLQGNHTPAGWYATKLWHAAQYSGWHSLSSVLLRLYVPISAMDACEFGRSIQSYMRCYSATLVFTVLRLYFLLDYAPNFLVLVSMIFSLVSECLTCLYVISPRADELDDEEDWWDAL